MGLAALPEAQRRALAAALHPVLDTLAAGDQDDLLRFPKEEHPKGPTPLYWRTVMATGVQPGEEAPSLRVQRHLGVARVPIPSRPLSYKARARRTDPQTSHDAARSVQKITETHQRVLTLLAEGPQTDNEIAGAWARRKRVEDWPPITDSGLRSRRKELVDIGKVVDSGVKGRTAAGRACIVWRLADGG